MTSSSSSSPELSPPSHTHPPNPYKYSAIDEVLDDLSRLDSILCLFLAVNPWSSRFILNLPDGELASLERICFQVEQAYGSASYLHAHFSPICFSFQTLVL